MDQVPLAFIILMECLYYSPLQLNIGQCYFIIEDDFESTDLRIERGIRARISNREAVKFENC